MNRKLTLSIDDQVIEAAKAYARRNRKSLSNIIEEYLKSLSKERGIHKRNKISQLVKELKGSVQFDVDSKSYKELLGEALTEKYLK